MFDKYGQEMDETRCKSNCSGDVTQACGSDLRMEVYEIGESSAQHQIHIWTIIIMSRGLATGCLNGHLSLKRCMICH